MITFAIVLLSLMALGIVTHFVPALRTGRTGYPRNAARRSTRTAELEDLRRTRQVFEFTLAPRREGELLTGDEVCTCR